MSGRHRAKAPPPDEPAAGIIYGKRTHSPDSIRKEKFNIAVLLVDHDMQVVMGICGRIAVFDCG
jgi:branched-chain amino acid transport system ATP-binding protein